MARLALLILLAVPYALSRSCKNCSLPVPDVTRDCPQIGFDCSKFAALDDFKVEHDNYGCTKTIKCNNPDAKLFVKGEVRDALRCHNYEWSYSSKSCKSTDTALCAAACEGTCSISPPSPGANVPLDAVPIHVRNTCRQSPCTTGYCKHPAELIGFTTAGDPPVTIWGEVTCSGDRQWRDQAGNAFAYVACGFNDTCAHTPHPNVGDCPPFGFDCSDTSNSQFSTVPGVNPQLQCADGSTLFVHGSPATVVCMFGKWKETTTHKEVHSAICGKGCTSCDLTATLTAVSFDPPYTYADHTTTATLATPNVNSKCSLVTCQSPAAVVGFNDNALPVFSSSLACTGDGSFVDGTTSVKYQHATCITDTNCGICDRTFNDFGDSYMQAQFPDYAKDWNDCQVPELCVNGQLLGANAGDAVPTTITTTGGVVLSCPAYGNKWAVLLQNGTLARFDFLGCPKSCPSLLLPKNDGAFWNKYYTLPMSGNSFSFSCGFPFPVWYNVLPSYETLRCGSDFRWHLTNGRTHNNEHVSVACQYDTHFNCYHDKFSSAPGVQNVIKLGNFAKCPRGFVMWGAVHATHVPYPLAPGGKFAACMKALDGKHYWVYKDITTLYYKLECRPAPTH